MFRDLTTGAEGTDVDSLQKALAAAGFGPEESTGRFDWDTAEAVRAMYESAGYEPPGADLTVAMNDVVAIPADGAQVSTSAPLGTLIDADAPMVTLTLGQPVAVGRAGVLLEEDFAVDMDVSWNGPNGAAGEGQIVSLSEFRPADEERPIPGFDLRMVFTEGEAPAPSATITIASLVTEELSLAVPSIAIRQDAKGTYVLVSNERTKTTERGETTTRVPVVVVRQADGWSRSKTTEPCPPRIGC